MKKIIFTLIAMTMLAVTASAKGNNTDVNDGYNANGNGNDVIEFGKSDSKGTTKDDVYNAGTTSRNTSARTYNTERTTAYNDRGYRNEDVSRNGTSFHEGRERVMHRAYDEPARVSRSTRVVYRDVYPAPRYIPVVRYAPCPVPFPPAPVYVGPCHPGAVAAGVIGGAVIGGLIAAACH